MTPNENLPMPSPKEPKSPPPCKVILLLRLAGQVRFGVRNEDGSRGFPTMPFPNLLAIDQALEEFARGELGLADPIAHGIFVERPDPNGSLYYLVEERAQPPRKAQSAREARSAWEGAGIDWMEARPAAQSLGPEDRRALARAMGYLSGQHFSPGRRGHDG